MKNKLTIVITGASRGIGFATASQLAAAGHEVHLVGRSFSDRSIGEHVYQYTAELTSFSEQEATAQAIRARTDKVDVLINNAGMYIESPFESLPVTAINELLNTNLKSHIIFTQLLLPLLKGSDAPLIINISSTSAFTHPANQAVYAASKAGLTAFSNSLRQELNPEKIRVTCIHPSSVNTWNAPNPEKLLSVTDLARTLQQIIENPAYCQVETLTISAV